MNGDCHLCNWMSHHIAAQAWLRPTRPAGSAFQKRKKKYQTEDKKKNIKIVGSTCTFIVITTTFITVAFGYFYECAIMAKPKLKKKKRCHNVAFTWLLSVSSSLHFPSSSSASTYIISMHCGTLCFASSSHQRCSSFSSSTSLLLWFSHIIYICW